MGLPMKIPDISGYGNRQPVKKSNLVGLLAVPAEKATLVTKKKHLCDHA